MPIRKPLSRKQASVLGLAVASALSSGRAFGDTVTFQQNANGHAYSYTFNNNPPATGSHTDAGFFPNDNDWSQSQVISTDGSGDQYESAPSNWSTPNYPNSAATDVELGSNTVTLDVNVTVDNLDLTAGGALNTLGGTSLDLESGSNNGTITVNSNKANAATDLTFGGGVLSGSGSIVLNAAANLAQINGSLTQAAGHSIAGQGEINAALSNSGIVNANVSGSTMFLQSNSMTNLATFEATGGATLSINGIDITQGPSGQISAAAGSTVDLISSEIDGGTLISSGNGLFVATGTNTLNNLTSNAAIQIVAGQAINVTGNLVDNGTILVNSNVANAATAITFDGGTLSGSGVITLNTSDNLAQLNGTVTQSAGHTIQGQGEIGAALTNSGLVDANVAGQTLYVLSNNMTNSATFEATNGGNLAVDGNTVTQTSGGQIVAVGSGNTLSFINANVSGGTISATSSAGMSLTSATLSDGSVVLGLGGTMTVVGGTNSIQGFNNSGTVNIQGGSVVSIVGDLTDNGSIVVNNNTVNAGTVLSFDGGTLSGIGTVTLNAAANLAQLNGTLTQGSGHTIQGQGEINAVLTNNGVVSANTSGGTMYLVSSNMTNSATFQAVGGGDLFVDSIDIAQGPSGVITAGAGSNISLFSSEIDGGSISSSGNGLFTATGTDILNNLTSSAAIQIPGGQAINVTGNLVDNGTILVNSNVANAGTAITFDGGTLSGSGVITLNASNNLAQLNGTVTQSAGHTIQGQGEVNAVLTNSGLVDANVAGQTLYVLSNNMTNSATFEATNGGNLAVDGNTVTQTSGGQIVAVGSGNTLSFINANVSGGTISATSSAGMSLTSATLSDGSVVLGLGGTMTVVGGTNSIQGFNNSGTVNIQGGSVVNIVGDLIDQGSIVVNNNNANAGTGLSFDGGTLSGGGTITLNTNTDLAQLNGTLTQLSPHTIQGQGEINAALTNSGTVNANINGSTMFLQTNNMTNSGFFKASNGGTLSINGITVTQGAAGQISAGVGSSVNLVNSTVIGGTLSSSGSGVISASGSDGLNGVTNNAAVQILGNSTVSVSGNLVDNGTIVVNSNSANAGTAITFDGGTLSGAGPITLNDAASLAQLNGSLTQAPTHTIQGQGEINAALINNGTVLANVSGKTLTLESNNMTNSATFMATSGGTLAINSITVTQSTAGSISASAGSTIDLISADIVGGTLGSSGSDAVVATGTDTLTNLTSDSAIQLQGDQSISVVGNLVDNGTILVNSNQANAGTAITFTGGGTLSGTGAITLNDSNNLAQLNGSLTQAAGHTIQGQGEINAALTNSGTVDASVTGQTLYLLSSTSSNSATFEATNSGNLSIDASNLTQTSGGQIIALGSGNTLSFIGSSTVTGGTISATSGAGMSLNSAALTGGTVTLGAGGTMVVVGGTNSIQGFTNGGAVNIQANSTLNIVGNLTDNGAISVNSNMANAATVLSFNGGTVTGSGSITLNDPTSLAQLNGTLTQASGHSILGQGEVNAALTNSGTLNANVSGSTMFLQTNNMTNSATFQATSGGTLSINGITVTQGAAGVISAGVGSTVNLVSTAVVGGTLSSTGTGAIDASGSDALTSVTNNSAFQILGGSNVSVTGNLVDNGTIVVNSNAANAGTAITFSGGTLSGPGTLTLNDSSSLAQLNGTLTQAGGHTIQGQGEINAALTNNGVVSASVSGKTLLVNGVSTNNSLFRATGGATLEISNGDLTNFSGTTLTGGAYEADASSTLKLDPAAAAVNANAANVILNGASSSFPALASLAANSGTLTIENGAAFSTAGSLTDTGAVNVGSTGAAGVGTSGSLTVNGLLHVTGSGVVNVTNSVLTINYGANADPGATIRGYLASGYNSDTWTGPGINSSVAASNPGLYAVGYADGTVDAGTPAAANQIIVENTVAGDSNLDGIVNFADLLSVAQNFNHVLDTHGNPIDWADGDFNYDGKVNFADLLLVAQNFNKHLAAGQLDQLPGSFQAAWALAQADVAAAQSNNVPEPGSLSLLAFGAAGLLARRRRSSHVAQANCIRA